MADDEILCEDIRHIEQSTQGRIDSWEFKAVEHFREVSKRVYSAGK